MPLSFLCGDHWSHLILVWASGAQAADKDVAWRHCALLDGEAATGILGMGGSGHCGFPPEPASSCISAEVASVPCVVTSTVKALIQAWHIFNPLMLLQVLPKMHCILDVVKPLSCVINLGSIWQTVVIILYYTLHDGPIHLTYLTVWVMY